MQQKHSWVAILVCALLMQGCVGDSSITPLVSEDPAVPEAGFFYGILHGLGFYLHILQRMLGENVAVYDLMHTNGYDFGFIFGVTITSKLLRLITLSPLLFFLKRLDIFFELLGITVIVMGVVLAIVLLFVDTSSPMWAPRAWPEGIGTDGGILAGMWHAAISPWISLCSLFGYESTLMASESTAYLASFSFGTFMTVGTSKSKDSNNNRRFRRRQRQDEDDG